MENRLQIVLRYMSLAMKQRCPEKYWQAQKLHRMIIRRQDMKLGKKIEYEVIYEPDDE